MARSVLIEGFEGERWRSENVQFFTTLRLTRTTERAD
jgi:hypothetical protein